MPQRFEPILVFLASVGIASFGGVAARLRSKDPVNWRTLLAAFLHSGFIGLVVCLALYNVMEARDNIPLLLAISGLAGIGGANVVDLILMFLGGKIKLVFSVKPEGELTDALPPPGRKGKGKK